MTPSLLPSDLDAMLERAVATFWATRTQGTPLQGGTRGHVLAGKNLDGFLEAARAVAAHCGVPDTSIFTSGSGALTLPGYYRPTKKWDVLIVHEHRLLAALEFKSQVGSLGNNFNNRAEEVIGSASDLWAAAHNRLYSPTNHTQTPDHPSDDPRPPFLGYLMLLEDSASSALPVALSSPHYQPSPDFHDSSYADRYRILCERLMEKRLYKAAALILSPPDERGLAGEHRALTAATSAQNMFAQLAGQLLADLAA